MGPAHENEASVYCMAPKTKYIAVEEGDPPEGYEEIRTWKVREDPFTYEPMGNQRKRIKVGQRVWINMLYPYGFNNKWGWAYVLKEIPNEDGLNHPWYLVGTTGQLELF